ncbi:MAG: hypothetical protein K2K81_11105 [Muribaculaceae bacterium]|nr:hypothetical protein [Muribaculaceae bacterium]
MKKVLALFCVIFSLCVGTANAKVTEIEDIWDIKYNNRPIVVEVYATWCAPCRMYEPIFNRVASEYSDRVDFYRMDVDGEDAHNFVVIESVPTTVILWSPYVDGSVNKRLESGTLNYSELKSYVEEALSKQYKAH